MGGALDFVMFGHLLRVFQHLKVPKLGVDMVFDGNSRGEVHLSSRYRDEISGICGNYNGRKDDDWLSPNGTLVGTYSRREWMNWD